MAALTRQKRLPSLKKLLEESSPRHQQSPEVIRQNVVAWAMAAGLKIKRRDGAPVV